MNPSAITSWFNVFDWSPTDPRWEQRRKATWAWRKFKKARRWARMLRFVPFVRMIAIGNSLGYGNCSPESDIDLVIVTAPRRIWTVRLLVVTLLRFFRQRPGEHTRDAICPSFFLTTEAMNLDPLQLSCHPEEAQADEGSHTIRGRHEISPTGRNDDGRFPSDPYLLFWLTQLTVLSDVGGTYDAFWRANEAWVRRWLPDARPRAVHPRLIISPPLAEGERLPAEALLAPRSLGEVGAKAGEGVRSGRFADAIERWARWFQERRFSPEIRALANQNSCVIVNDRMLKFHTNDRRAHYRDRWLYALSSRAAEQQS